MSAFTAIDLSRLPAPSVVEVLDYEAILAARKARLIALAPDLEAVLALESEPLVKFLEAESYGEMIMRARVNEAAAAVMLAYARGADLDHLAATSEVARLPGEVDDRLRARVQQSYHMRAAAGPSGAYVQHALGVSPDIIDVQVWSPSAGRVDVAVLARAAHAVSDLDPQAAAVGKALFGAHSDSALAWAVELSDHALLESVRARLNGDGVRPLTDQVVVKAAAVTTYAIAAVVEVLPGPDADAILARRRAALDAHLASLRIIAMDVTRAGIIAALVEPGVKNVMLASPSSDIVMGDGQIAACTSIDLATRIVHG